jgi:hypothetical protein
MKRKLIGILIVTLFIGTIIASVNSVSACTVFNATNDGLTLAGRNMDWYTLENFIAFLPSEEGKFGRVYFGWNSFPSWYMGGMNTQGVMFAYLAAPYLRVTDSLDKPIYGGNWGNLMEKCMEECSSVDEVLDVFSQFNLRFLENGQVMVVDRNGDSVIIEGDDITMKDGIFQIVTNFRPSHPFLGGYPCWRYNIAFKMLRGMSNYSVEYFTEILKATHQEGNYPTQWSIVYDLNECFIYLYHFHDFNNVILFNLFDELELGEHVYSIPSLFEPIDNIPPVKPATPSGDTEGKVGKEYIYTTSTTDPDGNQVYYKWYWNDKINETSDWIGPYNSGETADASHIWDEKGDYNIKVKAKDVHGEESPWSDPLPITMPKNRAINPFLLFLERLIERFPILEQILQPVYDKLA